MQRISIYDMDKTITRKATFGPFLLYAVPRHQFWRIVFVPIVALVALAYLAKLVSRGRLKEINLGLMIGTRIDPATLARLSRGFAGQTLSRNILAPALDQIARDRAMGRRVVLATASYQFYVDQIARLIGVADVVATRTTIEAGYVSPRIDGENCYGPAKLTMVKAWLADQGIARSEVHIRFYSDHVSDAPCMEWADEAFGTNPHDPLRALAVERGWAIYDWT
jgi:HAD superfamily phosphoserine phosphatase-like hydrolase